MILIGQFDSPFVRRVGIALELYGISYEHWPLSVFGDTDRIRAINPLVRVPTLVLDDGLALTDSSAILDFIDSLVPASQRLFPATEPERHRALRIAALGCGLGDKAVSLFYEGKLHATPSPEWAARCRSQIAGVLAALEAELSGEWFFRAMGHCDIVCATVLRFLTEVHPGLATSSAFPRLFDLSHRLESTAAFRKISQPFVPPV